MINLHVYPGRKFTFLYSKLNFISIPFISLKMDFKIGHYTEEQKFTIDRITESCQLKFLIDLTDASSFQIQKYNYKEDSSNRWRLEWIEEDGSLVIYTDCYDDEDDFDYDLSPLRFQRGIIWNPFTREVKMLRDDQKDDLPDILSNYFSKFYKTMDKDRRLIQTIEDFTELYIDSLSLSVVDQNIYHWYFNHWYSARYDRYRISYIIRDRVSRYLVHVIKECLDNPIKRRIEVKFFWSIDNKLYILSAHIYGYKFEEEPYYDIQNIIINLFIDNPNSHITYEPSCVYMFHDARQSLQNSLDTIDRFTGKQIHQDLLPIIDGYL